MAIIGIGIDVINIFRFKKLIINYGIKIPKKILSKKELIEYSYTHKKEKFLAIRFSIKEAIAKAIGISIFKNNFLNNCEIFYNKKKKIQLTTLGYIKKIFKKSQVKKIFLSVTDSNKHTYAIAILEK
ncbi:holo-ACP synthase [Buchnera aphidicola]|uniref:Holo-[acyl-carrier-protein] synthase n=1 Tax=Buchnera aphidicola subsp. Cinara cedri (strain Cc) TaxID=372461 RepID=ACPS_BUCCC|nr:holo-ACP synthase [Buchnera aphidicola]Q057R6.1 RecName: Full=Holo-[acyl-carrier-protein] synthase; Short=Holo-ACP synthase; AltName: Full=4'-phosphopantetheinyl transferase AcpS [Buchnera aphidicola BCc]ABJ90633.1 holo-(acyl-carrier protein) synthase [Buchnera aphidicola BCc]